MQKMYKKSKSRYRYVVFKMGKRRILKIRRRVNYMQHPLKTEVVTATSVPEKIDKIGDILFDDKVFDILFKSFLGLAAILAFKFLMQIM